MVQPDIRLVAVWQFEKNLVPALFQLDLCRFTCGEVLVTQQILTSHCSGIGGTGPYRRCNTFVINPDIRAFPVPCSGKRCRIDLAAAIGLELYESTCRLLYRRIDIRVGLAGHIVSRLIIEQGFHLVSPAVVKINSRTCGTYRAVSLDRKSVV